MMNDKKGAIELSISTIVIIVLAMTMLILGLVLVQKIWSTSTDSVDTLNDKIQNQISQLFTETGADVMVKLGAEQTAKIKAGTENFGIAIGSRTLDGSATDRNRLKYKLTLEEANGKNCISKIGKDKTDALFVTPLDKQNSFDKFQGANAFALIQVTVPKGTATCTQKVFIDVTDTKDNSAVGGNFFVVEILESGFF